jgi:ubiquinone/menaquinone biosynthesis C-methylase UbiE
MMKMNAWDKIYEKHGIVEKGTLGIVKDAIPIFRKGGCHIILDLGCGTGRHSVFLARNRFDVIAQDYSDKALEMLKEMIEKGKLDIRIVKNDMTKIDFSNNFFDGIIFTGVIHYAKINKIQETVKEILRVLRPRGILVMSCMSTKCSNYGTGEKIEKNTFVNVAGFSDDMEEPKHFFEKAEIVQLLKDFDVLEVKDRAERDWYGNDLFFWDVIARKK